MIVLIVGDEVTFGYLSFKLLVSAYLVLTYVISHVEYALSKSRNHCNDLIEHSKPISDNDTENNGTKKNLRTMDDDCEISNWPFYWIYFTNWSWTLLVISFLFDTVLVTLRLVEERKSINPQIEVGDKLTIPNCKGWFFRQKIKYPFTNTLGLISNI